MKPPTGAAGRLAAAFIHSKLTPLVVIASLLLGVYAVVALPREEEPQIIVPMVDVFVEMPGATPTEVEQRVTRPVENLLWEIPGVEYLYSTSSPGRAMVVVRFLVGQDEERALVRVNQKLAANALRLPPGASPPLVQARSIDDVPVMALTIWGPGYDDVQLRRIGAQLQETIKELPDISEVTIIGGRPRRVTVDLDPAAAVGARPRSARRATGTRTDERPFAVGERSRRQPGHPDRNRRMVDHARRGEHRDRRHRGRPPVRLADVASVADGGGEPDDYVMHYPRAGEAHAAVTLSIAKRKGTNAIDVDAIGRAQSGQRARLPAACRPQRDGRRATTAKRPPRNRTSCSGTCCSRWSRCRR